MMVPIKIFFLNVIIKLFIFLFILQLPAIAADVTIIPSLKLRGEYNDNIYFHRTNYVDDYIGHINPALQFDYVSELLYLKANADVDFLYYDDTDLNITNRETKIQLYELEGDYQIFERWKVSGDYSYRKDTTLDSYLDEIGRVNELEDRRYYAASGGLSHNINERSNIGIDYGYSETDYEQDSSIDNERHTVGLYYRNTLKNNLDIIALNPSYSHRNSYRSHSDFSEADTYTLGITWKHPFNETLQLESKIGGRYTEQSYNDGRKDEDTKGVVADINLTKTAQKYSFSMGYSRDLITDINGDEIEVDRFACKLNRQLTERIEVTIFGGLHFSRLDAQSDTTSNTDEEGRYYSITPLLYYLITENHYLELAYSYSNENNDNEPGFRDRHRVWLSITFTFPKKW